MTRPQTYDGAAEGLSEQRGGDAKKLHDEDIGKGKHEVKRWLDED